jgi:transmembrane 9 superfamily protein 3
MWAALCTKQLNDKDITDSEHAVMDEYFFEMFIDGLPMWGYVGDDEEEDLIFNKYGKSRKHIYPHLHFSVASLFSQIVGVNVTTDHSKRHDISPSNPP